LTRDGLAKKDFKKCNKDVIDVIYIDYEIMMPEGMHSAQCGNNNIFSNQQHGAS